MPCSGCSALHGVNPIFFKKSYLRGKKLTFMIVIVTQTSNSDTECIENESDPEILILGDNNNISNKDDFLQT